MSGELLQSLSPMVHFTCTSVQVSLSSVTVKQYSLTSNGGDVGMREATTSTQSSSKVVCGRARPPPAGDTEKCQANVRFDRYLFVC